MSNPAQPSFVWQLYHHDLDPNASLFAVEKACEPVHIMLNEKTGHAMILNNHPGALEGAAKVVLYNLDGSRAFETNFTTQARPSSATDLGSISLPETLSPVYFAELTLADNNGASLSRNFYWRAREPHVDELGALNQMEPVRLEAETSRRAEDGNCIIDVTLRNAASHIALMTHLQLRRESSGARVLPVFYSDNYVSLAPGESSTITITAAEADLKGEKPLVTVDGWNVSVNTISSPDVALRLNANSQPENWPETGLPIVSSSAK
jgi:beta-mannosidase